MDQWHAKRADSSAPELDLGHPPDSVSDSSRQPAPPAARFIPTCEQLKQTPQLLQQS